MNHLHSQRRLKHTRLRASEANELFVGQNQTAAALKCQKKISEIKFNPPHSDRETSPSPSPAPVTATGSTGAARENKSGGGRRLGPLPQSPHAGGCGGAGSGLRSGGSCEAARLPAGGGRSGASQDPPGPGPSSAPWLARSLISPSSPQRHAALPLRRGALGGPAPWRCLG